MVSISFLCVYYTKSVSFIELLRKFCLILYDEGVKILWKRVVKFELGQNLRVDKTGFLRPGHIYYICNYFNINFTGQDLVFSLAKILSAAFLLKNSRSLIKI